MLEELGKTGVCLLAPAFTKVRGLGQRATTSAPGDITRVLPSIAGTIKAWKHTNLPSPGGATTGSSMPRVTAPIQKFTRCCSHRPQLAIE